MLRNTRVEFAGADDRHRHLREALCQRQDVGNAFLGLKTADEDDPSRSANDVSRVGRCADGGKFGSTVERMPCAP